MFNFVATDATVKCYNISCLTSTLVAANLDESLHVFIKNILLSLHSWKMSKLLVKITSVGVTNAAGRHQTFRWLKQTDASLTSWTECHTPSQTARHWTVQNRWEVLVWLLRSWTERKSFLWWICSWEATALNQRRGCILLPAASLTFSPAASPPLSYHVLVWSASEGFNWSADGGWRRKTDQISPVMHRVWMFGRVESVLLLLLLFQTRLLLSVNLITSPLRHNLTSLFSFSTVRRESTWQCRLLLIQLHPSLHLPAATHLHADRSSMFLLVSPHGLHPSLLLQRFVWEVVFTSTRLLSSLSWTLILLRRVRSSYRS